MDWVKSERDEAQKSAEETAARLKEAETAASRAKSLRRDELKKEKKERNALVQRCEVTRHHIVQQEGPMQLLPCLLFRNLGRLLTGVLWVKGHESHSAAFCLQAL